MDKKKLEEKLEKINELIKLKYREENQVGVLSGLSGLSLFQFYYSKYSGFDLHVNIGMEILANSIEKINQGYNFPTFCVGIAGLGWVIDHIEQENFIHTDNDNLLSEFDDYLHSAIVSDMRKGNYDFLHGGIGYAFYFLNRYRNTKSKKLKKKYKIILIEFINLLNELSQDDGENKLKWLSKVDNGSSKKEEVYNLSLSHGMSSIIGILTKLYQYDDFKELTEKMLKGAINYILSFKNNDENPFSFFPVWIPKKGEVNYQSRLAWCYGDLGIGMRFWYAAKELGDKNLKNIAIDIMKHAAKRITPESNMVNDAGICHGSYGNAQIFYRMFKETDNLIFKEAAEFWLQDGINKATHNTGLAGYKQWKGVDKQWEADILLLEGIAGIGLTIIDYLADFDTTWDECLMIS